MSVKSILGAAVLSLAASAASAANFQNGPAGALIDLDAGAYSWTINVGALPGSLTSSFFESDSFLDITSVKLDGSSVGWTNITFGPAVENWLLGSTSVTSGSHTFEVTGTGNGRIFAGASFTAAPVPEPETYAMMLAGLGAIGFMARRRQAK